MRKEREQKRNVKTVIPAQAGIHRHVFSGLLRHFIPRNDSALSTVIAREQRDRSNPSIRFMDGFAALAMTLVFFLFSSPAHAACSGPAGNAGDVHYSTAQKILQYCDETNWLAMNKPGSGSGGCAAPVGTEGTVLYNTDHRVMQVCSGAQWVPLGPMDDEAAGVSTAGLVGHWKLDDGAGVTATDSAGSNDGTLNGGAWTTGVDNGALSLNGTSDYVSTVSAPDLAGTDHVTFSAWVKNSSTVPATTEPVVYKRNPQFTLAISGSGRIVVEINNDGGWHWTTPSSTAYSDWDQWHHVAAVYDGSTVTYYRDGVQEGTAGSETGNITGSSTAGIVIGRSSGGGVYWNGEIDDVRIYKRALSSTEIQNLYNASSYNADLVGHWKLDDGAGLTATDSVGNYDGTLQNGPVWMDGLKAGAVEFDGVDDSINVGDINELDGTGAFSIAFWIKQGASPGLCKVIVSKWAALGSRVEVSTACAARGDQNDILFIVENGGWVWATSTLNGPPLSRDKWTHVTAVFDGSLSGNINRAKIYLNGQNETAYAEGVIAATSPSNGGAVYIGGRNDASNFYNGYVDDVRIYSRALSASEAQMLYGCTAPAYVEGTMLYNPSWTVMQYCNGINWVAMGKKSPTTADCPNIGDVCVDGSVYAGLSPDGNVRMFATPADGGLMPWNNGNNSGYVTTGVTDANTGKTNTDAISFLDADSGTAGSQPHQAAQYCENLTAHGHNDWYLPSVGELTVLYTNYVSIGGFDTSGGNGSYYWASSEVGSGSAHYKRFSDGLQFSTFKYQGHGVRCVRKY